MPDTHLYFHKYIEIHHPIHEEEFTMTATYKKALLASAILLALSGAEVLFIPAQWPKNDRREER